MAVADSRPLRVLLASSEVAGFAKTGGLADVAGALPRALAQRGVDASVMMPLYRSARHGRIPVSSTDITFTIPMGWRMVTGRLWRAQLPDSSVTAWLVEQPDYFDRDDPAQKRGIYQFTGEDAHKHDYGDNAERFIFFSKAIVASLPLLPHAPDVLHVNDWQTGLVPALVKHGASRRPNHPVRTLFTLHNIAYQGVFPHSVYPQTGLPDRLFNWQELEYHGQMNFLKAGIVFADWLTTVSPSYAREIQTPYFGCGLEGNLSARRFHLTGVMNGVDYGDWNPATDRHLAANYDPDTAPQGKPACKADLQRALALPVEARTPLIGVVARLVEQKGIDLLTQCADAILRQDVQLAVLGEGDAEIHRQLRGLESRYPNRVRVVLGFDEPLAHRIEAGADLFVMPSRYEPAGLNQLYSLKYGTIPVVRATGGLADTIVDATEHSVAEGTATGFRFAPIAASALRETIERALFVYRHRPDVWRRIQYTGMTRDWSWLRSAAEYERLYQQLCK